MACFRSGIIGHVGIDFVALREEGMLRLRAVDLNLSLTSTQAAFKLFDFVCGGAFDPKQGTYLIDQVRNTNFTLFYGSSCANSGKDALNTQGAQ